MLKILKNKFVIFSLILIVIAFVYFNKDKESEKKEIEKAYINAFASVKGVEQNKIPEFDITKIGNKREKSSFDKRLREKILELIKSPLNKIPVSEMFIGRESIVDKGKYVEQKIRIFTSDSTIAYAYLLIPKDISLPAPAIIAMHQHGGTKYGAEEIIGNIGDNILFYGKELAERGYVVFAMDAPLFGEESAMKAGNSGEKTEVFSAQGLFVLGHSPLGVVVQEDLAGLDYLSSLDFVDKDRIGCIGHSFGGVRCMYLSALDERVKAVVLSNSVANLKFNYETGNTHTWFSILPGIAKYAETNSILALISPRSLLIFYSEKDPIFILYEAEKQIEPLKGLYNKLNKKESFASVKIPGKAHEFPIEYHEQAYEFLDKNLKN